MQSLSMALVGEIISFFMQSSGLRSKILKIIFVSVFGNLSRDLKK